MPATAPLATTPAHPASPALVAALRDDAFYRAIRVDVAGDRAAEDALLTRYFSVSLAEASMFGRARTLPDPAAGAAAWLLPHAPDGPEADPGAKAAVLATILGAKGLAAYHRIVDFMAPRAAAVVPPEAWYLSIIGVDPALQGRGMGEALLRPTLDEADAARVPTYLETFTPRNARFYARLGFVEVARHVEPHTKAEYLVMRRSAVTLFSAGIQEP